MQHSFCMYVNKGYCKVKSFTWFSCLFIINIKLMTKYSWSLGPSWNTPQQLYNHHRPDCTSLIFFIKVIDADLFTLPAQFLIMIKVEIGLWILGLNLNFWMDIDCECGAQFSQDKLNMNENSKDLRIMLGFFQHFSHCPEVRRNSSRYCLNQYRFEANLGVNLGQMLWKRSLEDSCQ
jgi:hypothetical protein